MKLMSLIEPITRKKTQTITQTVTINISSKSGTSCAVNAFDFVEHACLCTFIMITVCIAIVHGA